MLITSLLANRTPLQLRLLDAVLGLVLIIAVLYALTAPFTRWLTWYLTAQLVATLSIYGALLFIHETSLAYYIIYSAATYLILASIAWLVGLALRSHKAWILALIGSGAVSGALAGLVWYEVKENWFTPNFPLAEFIHISEGAFLLFSAICLGGSAPYLASHQRGQALSLTLLFFCQALFRWGFCLHITNEAWIKANYFIPFLLATSTYLWIGMRARDASPHRAKMHGY